MNLHDPAHRPFTPRHVAEFEHMAGTLSGYTDTCGHLCRYCYANYDEKTVRENKKLHNPNSSLLLGELTPDDAVHDAKQESWKDMQLRFLL